MLPPLVTIMRTYQHALQMLKFFSVEYWYLKLVIPPSGLRSHLNAHRTEEP